jgi:hypothetical protein
VAGEADRLVGRPAEFNEELEKSAKASTLSPAFGSTSGGSCELFVRLSEYCAKKATGQRRR